jgi:hypothetical protein
MTILRHFQDMTIWLLYIFSILLQPLAARQIVSASCKTVFYQETVTIRHQQVHIKQYIPYPTTIFINGLQPITIKDAPKFLDTIAGTVTLNPSPTTSTYVRGTSSAVPTNSPGIFVASSPSDYSSSNVKGGTTVSSSLQSKFISRVSPSSSISRSVKIGSKLLTSGLSLMFHLGQSKPLL